MYFRIVMMYRIVFSTRFIWFFSVLIEMCRRTCGTRLSERASLPPFEFPAKVAPLNVRHFGNFSDLS